MLPNGLGLLPSIVHHRYNLYNLNTSLFYKATREQWLFKFQNNEPAFETSTRFIGGKKEVAEFEAFRQVGPIVKVVPFSMGKGVVIAVLNDPNYEVIIFFLFLATTR